MAIKKSELYRSLWASCDELRGGMDASQYKDYILTLLFVKYVSDKAKADKHSLIDVPAGASFDDMVALKGDKEILGRGKEMQDRLSKLVAIFTDLDFGVSKAEGDDLLGDAYEFLMRHFA